MSNDPSPDPQASAFPLDRQEAFHEAAASVAPGSENEKSERKELPDDDFADSFFISATSLDDHAELAGLAYSHGAHGSLYSHTLEAIASVATGEGLDLPAPVIGVAQRLPETGSLYLLSRLLSGRHNGHAHLVDMADKAAASRLPERLAAQLRLLHATESLPHPFIILPLPVNLHAALREWEDVVAGKPSPLTDFLAETGKRLIIGFPVPVETFMSRFVNRHSRILPLPWGVPFIAALAQRGHFQPTLLAASTIERIDTEASWRGQGDDQRERGRFWQLAGLSAQGILPGDLEAALLRHLDDPHVMPEVLWKEKGAIVDEAFGLIGRDRASGTPAEPHGPPALQQALLFTAAFCPDLPGLSFFDAVKSLIDPQARIEATDLAPHEAARIAPADSASTPAPDPLPLVTDYFERHIDRIANGYHIVTDATGRMRPDPARWRNFPLAAHIGRRAPRIAGKLANGLMHGFGPLMSNVSVSRITLLQTMANLRFHLNTGFDDEHLVDWLTTTVGYSLHEGQTVDAAMDMAYHTVEFLGLYRNLASLQEETLDTARLEDPIFTAILRQDWQAGFAAIFNLSVLVLDRHREPASYRQLLVQVSQFMRQESDAYRVLRSALSELLWPTRSHRPRPEQKFERASRMVDILRTCREENITGLAAFSDQILEYLLNFDIRWPPSNMPHLLPYARMNNGLYLGQVVELAGDLANDAAQRCEAYLLERFFSVSAYEWLRRDERGAAFTTAGARLRDVIFILLDGVPDDAHGWRAQSLDEHTTRLFSTLCAIESCQHIQTPDRLGDWLWPARTEDPPSTATEAACRLYGLFWPALLLHWRFQLFGTGAILPGSRDALTMSRFFQRLAGGLSHKRLSQMADGMKVLEKACQWALVDHASGSGDAVALAFYSEKKNAIGKMRSFLEKAASETAHSASARRQTTGPAFS